MPATRERTSRDVRAILRAARVPVLLALLVGLLAAGLWWGWRNVISTPGQTSTTVPCERRAPTPFDSSRVTVGVYNGGARGGTAGQVAENLRHAGFTVRTVANTDERVSATIVRARAVDTPAARLVAGFFSGAELQADERPDDSVDVLIGREFAPMVLTAPTTTTLPQAECGPAGTSPAAATPTR